MLTVCCGDGGSLIRYFKPWWSARLKNIGKLPSQRWNVGWQKLSVVFKEVRQLLSLTVQYFGNNKQYFAHTYLIHCYPFQMLTMTHMKIPLYKC